MIYISYDGQVFEEVFNNYEEVQNFLINFFEEKERLEGIMEDDNVINMLCRTCVNGLSITAQMELFKDIYNCIMEENISLIDENGEFI